MARAVNDATLQKSGDIYQYLIALKDCFDLAEKNVYDKLYGSHDIVFALSERLIPFEI